MAQVPRIIYLGGRGRAEHIRLLFAVNNVKYEEIALDDRAQFLELVDNGTLLFKQLPLVEMDDLNMVQTQAVGRYLAHKYKLYGVDDKERFRIDMLWEGTRDFVNYYLGFGFHGTDEDIIQKAKTLANPRYMPIYEKILQENNTGYLVGNRLSLADVGLLEVLVNIEERIPDELEAYEGLQNFLKKLKSIPSLGDYLANKRFPKPSPAYVAKVKSVLNF